MGNKLYEENSIYAIATAIRQKLGNSDSYTVGQMAAAVASIPTGTTPTGTIQINQNGTHIDVGQYAYADVTVPTGGDLDLRDRLIIPDKYNTGARGFLTPFDLAGDTSGLGWEVTAGGSLKLDFNTATKQTIYNVDTSDMIVYTDVDFSAYKSIEIANADKCSKTDQYYKAGVVIVFLNCGFRKINSSYSFSSQDIIQFAFINCTMESFKLSNSYVEGSIIGLKTKYKQLFGDEDVDDGIKLFNYDTFINCFVTDIEPQVSTAGEAHYDGLQFSNDVEQTVLFNVRFECMNMPYSPKGGGWSYSVFYQANANNSFMNYCIFHGGGYYETSIKKNQSLSLEGNLVAAGYSTPCYPGEGIYQTTDEGLDTYNTLLVSSIFCDGKDLTIICTNDTISAKTLTVKLWTMDGYSYNTETFSIPACPSRDSGWTGITKWDDLPFDIPCVHHGAYNIGKVECYDGETKIRTWYYNKTVPVPRVDKLINIRYNGAHDVTKYSIAYVDGLLPTYIKNPLEFDYTNGYVDTSGTWIYQDPSNNYSDIYRVENGKSYKIMFGAVTGNRARGCLTTTDVRTLPAGSTVSGTFIGTSGTTIDPGTWYPFTSTIDGYLIIQKCNDQQADIQTYLFCVEDMTTAQPSGTKNITANGDGIDVAGYSAVNVNVPSVTPPSGKITILNNGTDIDVSQYALADVMVSGGGGTLPSDCSIYTLQISGDLTQVVIPYDNTKGTPAMMIAVPQVLKGSRYECTSFFIKMNFVTGASIGNQVSASYINYNGADESIFLGGNAGSATLDSTNHTVTFTTKSSTYVFKDTDVFDVYIIYYGGNS